MSDSTLPQQYPKATLGVMSCEIALRPAGAPHFADLAPALRDVRRDGEQLVVTYDDAARAQLAEVVAAERLRRHRLESRRCRRDVARERDARAAGPDGAARAARPRGVLMPSKSTLLVAGAAALACLLCLVPTAAVASVLALVLGTGAGAAVLGSGGIAVACLALAGAVTAVGLARRRRPRRDAAYAPAVARPGS
jgi:hypothetical protein